MILDGKERGKDRSGKYLEESIEVGPAAMLGDMGVWGHPVGGRGPPGWCCGALARSLCLWVRWDC